MNSYPNPDIELRWDFLRLFHTYNSAALRRGYKVFKNTPFYHQIDLRPRERVLLNKVFTLDEMKQAIRDQQMSNTPLTLKDPFEVVFTEDQLKGFTDYQKLNYMYCFMASNNLLAPPPNVSIEKGQFFNPYAPKFQTSFAPLKDQMLAFDDGVACTVPQMAHDLTTFLWFLKKPLTPDDKFIAVTLLSLCIFPIGAIILKRGLKANLLSRRIETYVTKYKN